MVFQLSVSFLEAKPFWKPILMPLSPLSAFAMGIFGALPLLPARGLGVLLFLDWLMPGWIMCLTGNIGANLC